MQEQSRPYLLCARKEKDCSTFTKEAAHVQKMKEFILSMRKVKPETRRVLRWPA